MCAHSECRADCPTCDVTNMKHACSLHTTSASPTAATQHHHVNSSSNNNSHHGQSHPQRAQRSQHLQQVPVNAVSPFMFARDAAMSSMSGDGDDSGGGRCVSSLDDDDDGDDHERHLATLQQQVSDTLQRRQRHATTGGGHGGSKAGYTPIKGQPVCSLNSPSFTCTCNCRSSVFLVYESVAL